MLQDSTRRFSSRVENYRRYRPGYPREVLTVLRANCGFSEDHIVADVGSGTGIFCELLLQNGNRVFGVEPNDGMRAAAEAALAVYPRFTSISGTAEATTLDAGSMDLVTAAQAFHWFEQRPTRAEFARILRPGGWVALIWNERQLAGTPFLEAYEKLLQDFSTDYAAVRQQNLDVARVRAFIGHDAVQLTTLPNRQVFDYTGLEGRLLSSSYAPESSHPQHLPMLARLSEIFERYAVAGKVEFTYDTQVYCARLTR